MDEYLILLLFLGILFALYFYRNEIFGKKDQHIIQPIRHKDKKSHHKKSHYKKHKHRKDESDSESNSSESSKSSNVSSDKSERDNMSEGTFPSIGSELSHNDDETFE